MSASRPSRLASFLVVALLIATALAVAGCGKDDDKGGGPTAPVLTTIPSSWEGVWSVRTIITICNTSSAIADTTITATLCGGTPVSELIGLGEGFCSNAVVRGTETTMSFSCSEAFSEEGCTGTFSLTLNGTVNPTAGTSITTGRLTLDSNPNTSECVDVCLSITQTGTRLPDDPVCPLTVAAPATLGDLLSRWVNR
jgi:hypothetical protein